MSFGTPDEPAFVPGGQHLTLLALEINPKIGLTSCKAWNEAMQQIRTTTNVSNLYYSRDLETPERVVVIIGWQSVSVIDTSTLLEPKLNLLKTILSSPLRMQELQIPDQHILSIFTSLAQDVITVQGQRDLLLNRLIPAATRFGLNSLHRIDCDGSIERELMHWTCGLTDSADVPPTATVVLSWDDVESRSRSVSSQHDTLQSAVSYHRDVALVLQELREKGLVVEQRLVMLRQWYMPSRPRLEAFCCNVQ